MWIPSVECKSCHKITNYFNFSDSDTYISEKEREDLRYGKGRATGLVSMDVVQIGSYPAALYAKNQSFVLIDYDANFSGMKADGILVRII